MKLKRTRRKKKGSIAAAPVDLEDRVVADIRCIACGASLQGHPVSEPCASCGHPCSDSVYGDYLIYADQSEIDRLDDAARLLVYSSVVLGLVVTGAVLATVLAAASVEEAIRRGADTLFAGVLVFTVIAVTGIVLLTRRGSVAYYEAKYFHQRTLIKAALVVATVLAALCVAAYYLPQPVEVGLLVAWATVPAILFLRGLGRLMRRVPNVKLASLSRALAVGVAAVGLLTFLFKLVQPLGVNADEWEGPLLALRVVTSLGWIGLGVASFRLLGLIRRNLRAIRR